MPINPTEWIGKVIKAFPYDANHNRSSVLVLPIVSGAEVVGYLPAASVDNGDGTASIKVETEIGDVTISNVNMNVEKWGGTLQTGADLTPHFQHLDTDLSSLKIETKIGSTDQTSGNARYIKTDADGVVQVAGIISSATVTNIEKWGGTVQSGADLTPHIEHIDVDLSTRATEATLLSVLSKLDDILTKIDVIVSGETPSGAINGVNDTFTTSVNFKPTTTHLYKNGVRLAEGPLNDYVEEVDHMTLTLAVPPTGGDVLLVDYVKE